MNELTLREIQRYNRFDLLIFSIDFDVKISKKISSFHRRKRNKFFDRFFFSNKSFRHVATDGLIFCS